MKMIVVLILALMIETSLAQEKTLISSGEMSNGGFGAPVIKFSEINDQNSLLIGARGGWIVNHSLVLGAGMYGLASNITVDATDGNVIDKNAENLHFMYGGIELEYVFSSMEVFHVSVYTLIGLGRLSINNYENGIDADYYDSHHAGNSFFVAEPAANLLVNVTNYFRVGLGIGYRFTAGANYQTLTDEKISGISGVLTLKFGSF